jgi:glycosyltransferase involved in cell wall biosynthesis
MHVVILNDFAYVNGGAGQVAIAEALALGEAGCTVTFFGAVGPAAPKLAASAARVVVLGQSEIAQDTNRLRASSYGLWNTAAASRLSEVLSHLDPDRTIVHIHSFSKALSASVVRTAVKREFRVVCTLHDYFSACPNGGFYDYQSREICYLKPMSAQCLMRHCDRRNYSHKLWRVARHWINENAGGMPDKVDGFIYSTDLSLKILRPYLPAGALYHKIPNPIDVPHLPPSDPGEYENFVAVGRIVPEKGFDLLSKAANSISASVTIIGDGENRAAVSSLAPAATITGWLTHEDTIARLRQSRALIFPSRLYETQGLAVWEAASQGIPAVVADTSAAVEGVIDGVTGLHFRSGDEGDLARKMSVFQDAAIARKMGRAAYERFWADPMTPEHHAKKLMICYEAILRR